MGDLRDGELSSLKRFMRGDLYEALERTKDINLILNNECHSDLIFYGNKPYQVSKLTSKEFRTYRASKEPICSYKLGCVASPNEVLSWGHSLKKLTSVKHGSMLLRVAHGEIYTKLKLFRFGLKESPRCTQCGSIETLAHKFVECPYVKRIWLKTFELTDQLRTSMDPNEDLKNKILGLVTGTNRTLMTIHAEVLTRIQLLKDDTNHTVHPKRFVELALMFLRKRERNSEIKSSLDDLLDRQ